MQIIELSKDFAPNWRHGFQWDEYFQILTKVEKNNQPRVLLIYEKFDRTNKGYINYSDFEEVCAALIRICNLALIISNCTV